MHRHLSIRDWQWCCHFSIISLLSSNSHSYGPAFLSFRSLSTDQNQILIIDIDNTGDWRTSSSAQFLSQFSSCSCTVHLVILRQLGTQPLHCIRLHRLFVNKMNTRARSSMRLRSQGANTDNDAATTTAATSGASRTALVSEITVSNLKTNSFGIISHWSLFLPSVGIAWHSIRLQSHNLG